MTDDIITGGCLCGALRYEAAGAPLYQGHCYCCDCRKASGSGFIAFMGFPPDRVKITGAMRQHRSPAANGNMATRKFCATCNSMVFGVDGEGQLHVYAGSLDDPTRFKPGIAIFTEGRPEWAAIPQGLKIFPRAPR